MSPVVINWNREEEFVKFILHNIVKCESVEQLLKYMAAIGYSETKHYDRFIVFFHLKLDLKFKSIEEAIYIIKNIFDSESKTDSGLRWVRQFSEESEVKLLLVPDWGPCKTLIKLIKERKTELIKKRNKEIEDKKNKTPPQPISVAQRRSPSPPRNRQVSPPPPKPTVVPVPPKPPAEITSVVNTRKDSTHSTNSSPSFFANLFARLRRNNASKKEETKEQNLPPPSQLSLQQIEEINKSINQIQETQKQLEQAINQQAQSLPSDNQLNPKFALSKEAVAEIKFLQQQPELYQYYQQMQKCFNEAFMFANLVSQGGASIEETSRIAKYLEKSNELLGDIPLASLIISQVKSSVSAISKAKTKGQQANFSDIVFTADPIVSSLLAEKIARRFVITRELNDQHQIIKVKDSLSRENLGRIAELKKYFKDKSSKFLKKIDQDIERGFFGKELSNGQKLAILDFDKSAQFIFKQGISQDSKSLTDEDPNKSEKIAGEIVSNALKLPLKYYQEQASSIATSPSTNQASDQQIKELQEQFAQYKIQQDLEKQQSEQKIKDLNTKIAELEKKREDDRQNLEKNHQQISEIFKKTLKIQDHQDKIKQLIKIAELAPDLEIAVGDGEQQQVMKLGDIVEKSQTQTQILEQNIGKALSQISSKLEELDKNKNDQPTSSPAMNLKVESSRGFKSCCVVM